MRSLRLARRPAPAPPITYADNFERIPESAAAARHLVVVALDVWRLPQLADTATLVLTELVSNSVRHASGDGIRVTVTRLTGQRVRVSVLDRDCARPQKQDPDLGGERGRGLLLVDAVSCRWGVDVLPGGKRVWADLESEAVS